MNGSKFNEGDIVEIPHPSGKRFVGWIVYVSNYFKDVIGVIVYGEAPMDLTTIETASRPMVPLYTSGTAAKHYGWTVVARRMVTPQDVAQTQRIVGGEVFVGDECTRTATEADRASLHKMLVAGMPVIFDLLISDNP